MLPCRPWQAVRRRVWAQRWALVGGYMQNPWLWLRAVLAPRMRLGAPFDAWMAVSRDKD